MKYYKALALGCKVNNYEIEAIKELLNQNGYEESFDERCDVFIINTCAVTQVSEQKSRQMIRKQIATYPQAKMIVMGCYSQLHPEIVKDIPGVDVVLGTTSRNNILSYIRSFEATSIQQVETIPSTRNEKYENLSITKYAEYTRAFVKIQDGCNNFCSYCIIPYTRGNSRSRNKEEIFQEIHALADQGFKEIVITGIDIGNYGRENKEEHYYFNDLLKDILNKEPRINRIRISSLEASQIDDEFISILKDNPRIAPHLHIPLQSGSAGVLKRMNRKYTKEEFLNKIKKIRQALPLIALACDVIVGFPGESEEEFEETCDFIKECGFDYLHVFPYSIRPGTLASKMENQIDPRVKKERVHRLIKLGDVLKENYIKQFDGAKLHVIIESYDQKDGNYKGYSGNYIEVKVKSKENIIGQLIETTYHI